MNVEQARNLLGEEIAYMSDGQLSEEIASLESLAKIFLNRYQSPPVLQVYVRN